MSCRSSSTTTVLPMYVEQLEVDATRRRVLQPIVAPTLDEGPHLSYTIQWFVFSVCVIVGWVLAVRRSIATRSGKVDEEATSSYIPIADDDPTELTRGRRDGRIRTISAPAAADRLASD